MSLNSDAANSLIVAFKNPRKGSCLTKELLAELASLLTVTINPTVTDQSPPCVSADPNNLASLDAESCLLVPAVVEYSEDQDWDSGAPADVVFDGFVSLGIDGATAPFVVTPRWSTSETGLKVVVGPLLTDTGFSAPSWSFKERSTNKIVLKVWNATQDATFTLQLLKFPVAPATA